MPSGARWIKKTMKGFPVDHVSRFCSMKAGSRKKGSFQPWVQVSSFTEPLHSYGLTEKWLCVGTGQESLENSIIIIKRAGWHQPGGAGMYRGCWAVGTKACLHCEEEEGDETG